MKEQTVTNAVIEKVREICQSYLQPEQLQSVAIAAMEQKQWQNHHALEMQTIQNKIRTLTIHLDKMYLDSLNGVLAESDFKRMYQRLKLERAALEEKGKELERMQQQPIASDMLAKKLVQSFLNTAYTNRAFLVSLIERIELTEQKQIRIKFRFPELP